MEHHPLGPEIPSGPPTEPPARTPLDGRYTALIPLDPSHAKALFKHVGGKENAHLWTYLFQEPYLEYEPFEADVKAWSKSEDPLYFTVLSGPLSDPSAEPIGFMTYMSIVPSHNRIEIGSICFSDKLKRTRQATETFYLLMERAFDKMNYTRLEWKANNLNKPSLSAADRLGFVFEGVFSRWDNFVLTATDPYSSDSWSDPVHFSFPGFDPSPFWDDDGKTYVSGAHTAAYYPGIMHAPLDLVTGEIGDIIMPWNGTGGRSPEAPHIWKQDGYYYLLLAEGGTRENHMVTMARSRNLTGPYEPAPGNPLLTSANNTSSYFQAVGHADLFQDSKGQWWSVALAVRAGGSYGQDPGAYFGNLPMGRETVLTPVTWNEGEFPVFTPVTGDMSGWPLPSEAIPEQGEGQLSDADDAVNFPPGSKLPIHFIHWRLPKSRNYAVSPPGHWNTLALKSSVLNLTAFDADFALGRGQTFVGRRMAHSLFRFRVDVDWSKSLTKEEMEVGISAIQDQAQHFDLGIVMLKSNGSQDLRPHLRFRGISETPYRAMENPPNQVFPLPDGWAEQKLSLQIEAVNSTHFAFSAGLAGPGENSEMRVFGYCKGTELVPYYSGVVLGVYATSNGKHGEQAFETYISNWRYTGVRQLRSQEDVDDADGARAR
ncbi:hypothetical protein COL154_012497 [Colletotrichum chrysophilum]|nr:hypothetical protein COL154_012497 [Colletotrichum chrysophilum]